MDRSCRLLHGQPSQPFEWNYFPLLTGRIVLSNKKRNLIKYSVVFFKHFPKKKSFGWPYIIFNMATLNINKMIIVTTTVAQVCSDLSATLRCHIWMSKIHYLYLPHFSTNHYEGVNLTFFFTFLCLVFTAKKYVNIILGYCNSL